MTTGIAPSVLWAEDPADLATMVAVIDDQNKRLRRR